MEIEEAGTPSQFIVLRKEVMEDKNLSTSEKLVYARICTFDEYFESCERAAEILGIAARTIRMAKRTLEIKGYIEETRNTGRGKAYRACYDLGRKMTDRGIKNVNQTDKKCHSECQKMSLRVSKNVNIYKNIKENIKESESVGTADAVPALPQEAYQLAEYLQKRILANKPNRKLGNNWKENWARSIEKIHRIDKRKWVDIKRIIDYSQSDSFWWKNVLSGETLRKQFERLEDDSKDKTNKMIILS